MNESLEKIQENILSLPIQERAKLAQILLYSLDDKVNYESESNAWDTELKLRVKSILDGTVKGIPAEEVFAKIQKKYH